MPVPTQLFVIVAVCFCIGSAARADTKLTYTMNGAETFHIAIRGNLVRWDFGGGPRDPMTIVYDNKRRQLDLIDERRKRIYPINDATIAAQNERDARRQRALESARRDYRNMSPERRRAFEKRMQPWQLKRLQGNGSEGRDGTTVRLGTKATINGYPCQFVDTILNDRPKSQVCVAGRDVVNMPKADYATLMAMFRFLGTTAKTARMRSTHFARHLEGVPLQLKDNRKGKVQTIKSIALSPLSDDAFKLPPYERIDPMARRKNRR